MKKYELNECPYCGADIEIDINYTDAVDNVFDEDEEYEYECDFCGKIFLFSTSVIIDFRTCKLEHNNETE